ncbi:alpha/beta hydrolase [Pseudohalocynthiibacter aestuariivivens]|nr:alpha/beta hydrolase [Pseudohalocynthiibacter aestuariivivens]QIE46273.1 alpha/beta hydrolase [Pseudohalocynthiibacter aestuariivivens]
MVNDPLSNIPSRPSVTGTGQPIIFVHGNASTREVWTDVVGHLKDDHCCISYDLRGHGDGCPSDDTLSLDQLVEDLEKVRAATGHQRVALVGHSLGAFIVARYAERHPGRVDWISLMAMPAGRTEGDKKSAADLLQKMKTMGVAQTMPVLSSSWYTESFTASHPGALQKRLDQVLAIDEAVFLRFYGLYSCVDVDASLPHIAKPALIMTGEHARGCGAEVAANVAGLMHDASTVVFADMKNGILTEIPEKVAQSLHEFAASIREI